MMNFGLTVSASFSVAYSGMMAESELITVKMYQNNWNTPVYDIYTGDAPDSGNVNIDINIPKTKAGSAITVNNNDVFFIGIKIGASSVAEIISVTGSFFLDLYFETEVTINKYGRLLWYAIS